MKWYTIEIDERVWNHLKLHAEPFSDTPNSVLNKLLFGTWSKASDSSSNRLSFLYDMPKALSQILEVIYEVKKLGRSRAQATKIVAQRKGTAPQTVIDKYCRQLDKKAYEIDRLLDEPNLAGFKALLKNKFVNHRDEIDSFFQTLSVRSKGHPNGRTIDHSSTSVERLKPPAIKSTLTKDRKHREPNLETSLKNSLANCLKSEWGQFHWEGNSQLVFPNASKSVLCAYSSFYKKDARWFWGVSPKYWTNWEPQHYLALIMENEDGRSYSFILLDSRDVRVLLDRCGESDGHKKINMRIYKRDGEKRFIEWKEFEIEDRMKPLQLYQAQNEL